MGRPKGDKKTNSIFEKRQKDLKLMCGSVEKQEPKPFNPNFMGSGTKTISDVSPQVRMMRDELQEFINKFQLYSGQDFDDPAVKERYFGTKSNQILGLINGRKLIYLLCIDRIPGITIDEFMLGVLSPTRSNQMSYAEAIEVLHEWMTDGLLKSHRLSPEEKESGRKDYSMHGKKMLELTPEGKQLVYKIDVLLNSFTRDLLVDAVTRRDMFIAKLRKEDKTSKKEKDKPAFSKETLDTVAKMKELLGHK